MPWLLRDLPICTSPSLPCSGVPCMELKGSIASPVLPDIINRVFCVLPKGRSFTTNSGTKAAVLPKGRSSTANSGTKVVDLPGMNRRGSFSLLSALHYLFSIWTDLKRSEKTPGAPTWRWGEWIWLTGPSGLHRNSPQGLNISFIRVSDQIRDPEIPITLRKIRRNLT